jgi:hypothetical protein
VTLLTVSERILAEIISSLFADLLADHIVGPPFFSP